jgi:predicted ATPase
LCCIDEVIRIENWTLKTIGDKHKTRRYVLIDDNGEQELSERINFHYQGSILTQLADQRVLDKFQNLVDCFKNIHSFDLLSPYFLKQSSKTAQDSIGLGGEDFAAFLYNFTDEQRSRIVKKIKEVYPLFSFFRPRKLPDQNIIVDFDEQYYDGTIIYTTPARGINDGLLRLIAILTQLETKSQVLLFDEIEDGINQEQVEFLLDQLIHCGKQIVVTTHSPLFLNYLEDDMARKTVQYFYKTPEGLTHCIPFFSIPSVNKKLKMLGPGEVIADTNLTHLNKEIQQYQPTIQINN